MQLKEFKSIVTQVNKLLKLNLKFEIGLDGHYNASGTYVTTFSPSRFEIKSLENLEAIQDYCGGKALPLNNFKTFEVPGINVTDAACVRPAFNCWEARKTTPTPTLRFYPLEVGKQIGAPFTVCAIIKPPVERQEGDRTYRVISDAHRIWLCVNDEHKAYNYLDQGHFFVAYDNGTKGANTLITNELTFDTWLVILLCYFNPKSLETLTNGCFLLANTAKVVRARLEKALVDKTKKDFYDKIKAAVTIEFEKINHDNGLRNLMEGKITAASYNEIRITKDRASYETVSIQADDLLEVLGNKVQFDDHTDIYSLIKSYVDDKFAKLELHNIGSETQPTGAPAVPEFNFVINGIPIKIHRTADNTRRYVNDLPIKTDEVGQVVFRSSCFTSQEVFEKFVKEVSKMSLLWHDILANGLKMKIDPKLTQTDYSSHEPPNNAPRLRFRKVGREVHIVFEDGTGVKIQFSRLINQIATANRKTNNRNRRYNPTTYLYESRNGAWCAKQVVEAVKRCCTYPITVTTQVEGQEPVITVEERCLVTDAQAEEVLKFAQVDQDKAIQKSKEFLATAVKATGAELKPYKGDNHYIVKGTLHTYAVHAENNRVYNHDTGRYVCIVEPGHTVGVGYDKLAARLFALKNDARMVDKITTLRAG